MLRNVHIPRYIIALCVLACALSLSSASVVLAASNVQLRQFPGNHPQHYLALGDSLAYGFQPDGDHTHGYVDDFFSFLQQQGVQDHVNLGCPGETSSTFINGGVCTYPSPFSSQLAAALAYLQQQAQSGQVTLVTLNIGANDILKDINPNTCTVSSTFTTDLQTLDHNLTRTILPQLHAALRGNGGQTIGNLMLLNNYDPFQNVCPKTVQDTQEINEHLAHDVQGVGTVVNVFGAFGGAGVPNPNICNYTWICSSSPGPDIHPTTEGYQVMASALEKSCSFRTNRNLR